LKKSLVLKLGAAAVAAALAVPAMSANIVLIDSTGSFSSTPQGAEALFAFQKAANYWNKTLTNNATINIDISFAALGTGILGSTGSNSNVVSVADVYHGLQTTGNSALDATAVAHLPTLANGTDLAMRVNAYKNAATQSGIDTTLASRISNGSNGINQYLDVNTSVLKAMGMSVDYSGSYAAHHADASITFSSNFAFDFNPTDGIATGKYDFTAVAVHEIGHALGFVSGSDTFDLLGGKGPYASAFNAGAFGTTNIDEFAIGSTLDLFRYGSGVEANGTRYLNWGANKTAFFSIDGGASVFNLPDNNQEAAFFSTGQYNGDGNQTSHWADNKAVLDLGGQCFLSTRSVGIMDPTIAACSGGSVTQNDLAAFDAMGWNLNQNILANPTYNKTTADIYAMDGLAQAVPEPETYAMLLAGLGLTGFAARRRKAKQA
jgi:hypothetical protein